MTDGPGLRGDEAELFARYNDRLQRVTRRAVNTTQEVVEEACAEAWTIMLRRQPERDTLFAWLRVVARNEAIRLDQAERAAAPMDWNGELSDRIFVPGAAAQPPDLREDSLDARRQAQALPPRLRHVLALKTLGFKYDEIAVEMGISPTRVNQLITRANDELAEVAERERPARSARAARLRELETKPPGYLVREIGRLPPAQRHLSHADARREWRRLAISIDDYRERYAITDNRTALGPKPSSSEQLVERRALESGIAEWALQRGLERDR